jgi:hypothetical protein
LENEAISSFELMVGEKRVMKKTEKELCQLCREDLIVDLGKTKVKLTNGVICVISRIQSRSKLWFFDFTVGATAIHLIAECCCLEYAVESLLARRSFERMHLILWTFNGKTYQPGKSGAAILAEAVQKGQPPELAVLTH